MARYAKAGMTIDDLKQKIKDVANQNEPGSEYPILDAVSYCSGKLYKDLHKIDVDYENVDGAADSSLPGAEDLQNYEMINGIPFAWGCGGGDWESPVAFVLYIGDDGSLRGYIPEDGNAYNHKTKAAYGNEDYDEDVALEQFKSLLTHEQLEKFADSTDIQAIIDELWKFDSSKLREDVKNRIAVKG